MIPLHGKILTRETREKSERRQTNYSKVVEHVERPQKAVNNLFSSLSRLVSPLHTCALVILTLFFIFFYTRDDGEAVIYFSCSFTKHENWSQNRLTCDKRSLFCCCFFQKNFFPCKLCFVFFFIITLKFTCVWEKQKRLHTHTYCSEEKLFTWKQTIETESSFLYSEWDSQESSCLSHELKMYVIPVNMCHWLLPFESIEGINKNDWWL